MSRFPVIFALFACVFAQDEHANHNHEVHRVNVAVYYESLCPDSIKFFTKQLYPSLQNTNISQYVNLTLVPYGKATTKHENGQISFTCHHGEGECRGNKLQACALKYIGDGRNTEGFGYNIVTTAFINCLMDRVERKENDTQFPTAECATMSGVTDIQKIETCQTNPEANNLLDLLGQETEKLNPKLKSVPYIVFNNQQKDEDSKLANENFIKGLCQYIQGTQPAECVTDSAAVYGINIFVVLVGVASYFF